MAWPPDRGEPRYGQVRADAMSRRAGNPRLVKIHRSYSVEEAASQLAVHKNTVREWIRRGLPTVDHHRPTLILGRDLAKFLEERRKRSKRPCAPGQIYCIRCRCPREPEGQQADYLPLTATGGNLMGTCPVCATCMYRRVNVARIGAVSGNLRIRMPQAERHIVDSPQPSVNSDLARE